MSSRDSENSSSSPAAAAAAGARSAGGGPGGGGGASPTMASFLRFFRGANGATPADPNMPGSPQVDPSVFSSPHPPPLRSLSDPLSVGGPGTRPHSGPLRPIIITQQPAIMRSRSLENDPLCLPESAVLPSGGSGRFGPSSHPASPSNPFFRAFAVPHPDADPPAVQSGGASSSSSRRKSNGFLELLASQDSFMGSD